MQQLSSEPSPQRKKSPIIVNSTELSGTYTAEIPKIFSEPDIVTLEEDYKDPTFPYGFGAQQPIVLPSLIDLNLPPNPFNILTAMTVLQQNPTRHNDKYSLQSPEPSETSPISTPHMNLSTIDGCETPHTTTDDNTFF